MKEINYLEIIKKSWSITWKNKYLWWFGLFLVLGGGFNFNLPGNNEWNKKIGENGNQFENFMSQHWQLVMILIIIAILIGLALFVLSLISRAGLIKTLDKIEKNSVGSFKEGFKEGKKYFWKLLATGIILGVFIFALLVVLAVPVILLFSIKALILGILAAFLAFIIFIPLLILAVFIGKYAIFYIVLSDLKIKASIENGYQIFRKNILSSVIMALFFIPINIVFFLAIGSILLVVGLVFLLVGLILNLVLAKAGIIITVSIAILVAILSLIAASSIFQVFSQVVWFLFFKEVAKIKEEELIKESTVETEITKESLPNPEEA